MPLMIIIIPFLVTGLVIFISYRLSKSERHRDQILSVTSLDRGTWSERDLITQLINECGINSRAIYHDLYIRKDHGNYTQIDLVVPTPQGIMVFEVKDYTGWIFGNGNSKYWMQILAFGREKHQFFNPILQNQNHISSLRKLLPNNPNIPIFNVVVFYGKCEFKHLDYETSGNVHVIYKTQVADFVRHIKMLPHAIYGNKHEVADVLAEGVKNGLNQDIRQSQINMASRIRSCSKEFHTYSVGGSYNMRRRRMHFN